MMTRMKAFGATLILALVPASAAWSWPSTDDVRRDVNFAFGGALAGAGHTSEFSEPELNEAVRAAGLELLGLEQQLELARDTLLDVDSRSDLFWVFAGGNNYLVGERDPTVAPSYLRQALTTLYDEVDARLFVVPNLPPLGELPLYNELLPEEQAGLSSLAQQHNEALAEELAAFAFDHPDAHIVAVDSYAVFESLASNASFTNRADSCVEALPDIGDCTGWVFLDDVHPTSAAMGLLAEATAAAVDAQLRGRELRRLITLGDSLSDTGAFQDTVLRATGKPLLPDPPYYDGRFADGPNVVEQVEELLDLPVRSSYFAQPYQTTLSATPVGRFGHVLMGQVELSGRVFVPASIDGEGVGVIWLSFDDRYCAYLATRRTPGWYRVLGCSRGVRPGDRLSSEEVHLGAYGRQGDRLDVTLLYY